MQHVSLKTELAELYRSLLPCSIREPAWHATRTAWAAVVLRNPLEMRRRYAEYLVARGRFLRTVHLNEGFTLDVDLRDEGVGRTIFVHRTYEPRETDFLKSSVRPGMTVVDIGANLGYYTVLASLQVGPHGKVLAIEPDPDNFDLLERNIRKNGLQNVTALNLALGPAAGTARLHRSATNFGDHRVYASDDSRESVEVPVLRLDDVLARLGIEQVEFLKMDVQGFEAGVVAGMGGALLNGRIRGMLMEYWPYGIQRAGGDVDAMRECLADAGFSFTVLGRQGSAVTCPPAELDSHLPNFDPNEADGCFFNLWLSHPLKAVVAS